MSLADDLDLHGASARQAFALASPKTALAPLTPSEAAEPAVEQVVRLAPGATVPEQEPPPKAPAVRAYDRSSFGSLIPISLGRRRLPGTVIQSSAIVPRLVGNKEYEITYEIPAVEVVEPVEDLNDGDDPAVPMTIWCNDCNCYYCYVGPLDINIPYDNYDKGTWPYMAMMGKYRSRLCTSWDYSRIASIDEDYHYGALYEKRFGDSQTWNYVPPHVEIAGFPSAAPTLTCGPCAGSAPFPDSVSDDLEPGLSAVAVKSPAPYTWFVYGGYFRYGSEGVQDEQIEEVGFFYLIMQAMARSKRDHPFTWIYGRIFRVYYDPSIPDDIWPGSEDDLPMPSGWHTAEDERIMFTVWSTSDALTGLGDDDWASGQNWRDWVKAHGGWAPEDEPSNPPDYRLLEVRRVDPTDPFSEFKLLPLWSNGMAEEDNGDGPEPLHTVAGVQCENVTDYSTYQV